jgi:hypothetical protein
VSKDVPHCPFLRFEVTMVACVWGGLRKTPLLLSMQWHERSDQHHDQHWSHANNFLSRRVLRSTMATRLLRRGIPLSVQSHNSWVDFGRPSFWITLQISQFMVRSLFPACFAYPLVLVFDLPLFDNPRAADLFPTIPAIQGESCVGFMPGVPVHIQTLLQARWRTESRRYHFSRVSMIQQAIKGDATTNGRRALDIKQALRALDGASIALSRRNKRSEIQLSSVSIPTGFRGRLHDP